MDETSDYSADFYGTMHLFINASFYPSDVSKIHILFLKAEYMV